MALGRGKAEAASLGLGVANKGPRNEAWERTPRQAWGNKLEPRWLRIVMMMMMIMMMMMMMIIPVFINKQVVKREEGWGGHG